MGASVEHVSPVGQRGPVGHVTIRGPVCHVTSGHVTIKIPVVM